MHVKPVKELIALQRRPKNTQLAIYINNYSLKWLYPGPPVAVTEASHMYIKLYKCYILSFNAFNGCYELAGPRTSLT